MAQLVKDLPAMQVDLGLIPGLGLDLSLKFPPLLSVCYLPCAPPLRVNCAHICNQTWVRNCCIQSDMSHKHDRIKSTFGLKSLVCKDLQFSL